MYRARSSNNWHALWFLNNHLLRCTLLARMSHHRARILESYRRAIRDKAWCASEQEKLEVRGIFIVLFVVSHKCGTIAYSKTQGDGTNSVDPCPEGVGWLQVSHHPVMEYDMEISNDLSKFCIAMLLFVQAASRLLPSVQLHHIARRHWKSSSCNCCHCSILRPQLEFPGQYCWCWYCCWGPCDVIPMTQKF